MVHTETITYNDQISRRFVMASVIWGLVGMAAGAFIALQLAFVDANLPPYLNFGRLRPVHTNAVIFAFVGNMIFAGILRGWRAAIAVPATTAIELAGMSTAASHAASARRAPRRRPRRCRRTRRPAGPG
jgi:cbb3-type cytochrome oxidase subunit 1